MLSLFLHMPLVPQANGDHQPDAVHHPRVVGLNDVLERLGQPEEGLARASERNFRIRQVWSHSQDNQIITKVLLRKRR